MYFVPGGDDDASKGDRNNQLENVKTVVSRGVLPGNMFLRIRAHANAIENLPLALLLLGLLEWNQTAPLWLHVCGCVLLAGRVLHALGMSIRAFESVGRVTGIALTWGVMAAMAVLLLWQWLVFASIR